MMERAVYNAETSRWYRHDHIFAVRILGKGERVQADPGVVAASYPEAFELIYGHAMPMPPLVRAPRREPILP